MGFVFKLYGSNTYAVNGCISGVLPLGVDWAIHTPWSTGLIASRAVNFYELLGVRNQNMKKKNDVLIFCSSFCVCVHQIRLFQKNFALLHRGGGISIPGTFFGKI